MQGWSDEKKAMYHDFLDQMIKDGYVAQKIKRKSSVKQDPIPYQAIAELYNDFAEATNNPQIETLTEARKRIIKKAWDLDTKHKNPKMLTNNLEYFKRLFDYAKGSEFLHGDTERSANHSNWRPSFEFVLREDTHLGLREGKY